MKAYRDQPEVLPPRSDELLLRMLLDPCMTVNECCVLTTALEQAKDKTRTERRARTNSTSHDNGSPIVVTSTQPSL